MRLVLPFLFHWLELCLLTLPQGTSFTSVKSSYASRVRGLSVAVIYWLHYSWRSCGKSLNHWPLASGRVYRRKTLHVYPPYPTISWGRSLGTKLGEPLLPCRKTVPISSKPSVRHFSCSSQCFSFFLCSLPFVLWWLTRPSKPEEIPGSSEQALSSILRSSTILKERNAPLASGEKSSNNSQKVYLNMAVYFCWRLSYLPL